MKYTIHKWSYTIPPHSMYDLLEDGNKIAVFTDGEKVKEIMDKLNSLEDK